MGRPPKPKKPEAICAGCGAPSPTLYCDACAPPQRPPETPISEVARLRREAILFRGVRGDEAYRIRVSLEATANRPDSIEPFPEARGRRPGEIDD